MTTDQSRKVTASHLKRCAYLYVRQSTIRQVFENSESTRRQYDLKDRAIALGWPSESVIVIDSDLGLSGASAVDRAGFQRLVTEVGLGNAGIVLGLEVSRLARNSSDWHRLLEICALSDTLLLDEDGVYSPRDFNDRLLLGLKGTMSEAELHFLRARLRGGIENKARRGELKSLLPVGLTYDNQGKVVLDPDKQIQEAIRSFFNVYERAGSAMGVVRHFREEGLLFPSWTRGGSRKGELVWGPIGHTRALQMLHNPRYAGVFFFGRTRSTKTSNGRHFAKPLPQDEWHTLIPGAHPGYISWEQYQRNQKRLTECARWRGSDRMKSPPGKGPALLQGIAICGVCGRRMTVRYHHRRGQRDANYLCQVEGIEKGQPICQSVQGTGLDKAIGELLLRKIKPHALRMALTVQEEIQSRLDEADALRRQQVERARYEAELARQRFTHVDPRNRLVADSLEAEWNEKLRALRGAEEEYENKRKQDRGVLEDARKTEILALAKNFPKVWRDPRTPIQERKRMARLLIEDVTIIKTDRITAHVRLRGGTTQTLSLPVPLSAWQERKTDEEVIAEIDRLLEDYTEAEIAVKLNAAGTLSGMSMPFTGLSVRRLRRVYGLRSRRDRLRTRGMLTQEEMASELTIHPETVHAWRRHGLLKGYKSNDKPEYLYDPPEDDRPVKTQGWKLSERTRFPSVTPDQPNEVQNEQ